MKLYWRVKKDGKWTWVAFSKSNSKVDFKSPSGWSYQPPHPDVGPVVEGPEPQPEPLE